MLSTRPDMTKALFWNDYTEMLCLQGLQIFHGWAGDSNPRVRSRGPIITKRALDRSANIFIPTLWFIPMISTPSRDDRGWIINQNSRFKRRYVGTYGGESVKVESKLPIPPNRRRYPGNSGRIWNGLTEEKRWEPRPASPPTNTLEAFHSELISLENSFPSTFPAVHCSPRALAGPKFIFWVAPGALNGRKLETYLANWTQRVEFCGVE